jgi:hypothetical protein
MNGKGAQGLCVWLGINGCYIFSENIVSLNIGES